MRSTFQGQDCEFVHDAYTLATLLFSSPASLQSGKGILYDETLYTLLLFGLELKDPNEKY